jgi:pimeloyl-ACP methyl ester carboxylesterase
MPESRFVQTNGIKQHYLDWGGDGPPLVCLHGITNQCHTWDEVAAALSPAYRVLSIDLRGHGDSEKPAAGYAPADFGADLEGFARTLGLNQFILMGHSLGGYISAYYAGVHPERLTRLILVDSSMPRPADPPDPITVIMERENRRPVSFPTLDAAAAYVATEADIGDTRSHAERWTPQQIRTRTRNLMRQRPDSAWEWKYSRPAIVQIGLGRQTQDPAALWENAKRVTCPALLVRGELSPRCTPELAREMQAAFQKLRVVTVPDVSHSPHLEDYPRFMAAITEFLR